MAHLTTRVLNFIDIFIPYNNSKWQNNIWFLQILQF